MCRVEGVYVLYFLGAGSIEKWSGGASRSLVWLFRMSRCTQQQQQQRWLGVRRRRGSHRIVRKNREQIKSVTKLLTAPNKQWPLLLCGPLTRTDIPPSQLLAPHTDSLVPSLLPGKESHSCISVVSSLDCVGGAERAASELLFFGETYPHLLFQRTQAGG